jgi:hypothetical protein
MGHLRKTFKELSIFVCIDLILTLWRQKATIFDMQCDAEQAEHPL